MTSAERFQNPAVDDGEYQEPGRELEAGRRPRTRTTRRFEIGFFIRKIENGRVVFFKEVPSYGRRAAVPAPRSKAPEPEATTILSSHAAGGASHESGDEPTVAPASGTPSPGGTPGPVGGASLEIGLFANFVTVTEDEKDDH